MLNKPVISFHSIADDGVEYQVSVYADSANYVVTADSFLTDVDDPRSFLTETGEKDLPTDVCPADLNDGARRLIAGLHAFKLHREFEDEYAAIARRFKNKKKRDDGLSDEGVPS
jgi:hypothetical protein